MKKRISVLLSLLLAFYLTACGKGPSGTDVSVPVPEPSENTGLSEDANSEEGSGAEAPEESQTGLSEVPSEEASAEGTLITITSGGQIFEAVLDDSETAAAFADMLPMTLSMQRVGGGREFYGGMDSALPYDEEDAQTGFENGDIAFWLGGDGLCLLYNDQVERPEISAGIIVFGKITSDLSGFFDMDDNSEVVIESAY